jgi:hypothetical protein
LRKLNLGHLNYLKSMGPSQGSISASPESASIAPDFGRGGGPCGSPASNAFYSSAQIYCFSSIFAHYCRYCGTFPLCGRCSYARSYHSAATVIMCANRERASEREREGIRERERASAREREHKQTRQLASQTTYLQDCGGDKGRERSR